VSAEALRVVEEIQSILTEFDVVAALDDPTDRRAQRLFMELAEPDFDVTMVDRYQKARLEYSGFEGFVEAWRDWTNAFESFRVEVEEMIEAGEQVVSLVTMTGKIEASVAEVKAPGAAVWTVAGGRVSRVEFHLDRDAALHAAGLKP